MSFVRSRLWLAWALAASVVVGIPAAAAAKAIEEAPNTHCVVFVVDKSEEGELKMTEPVCFAAKENAAALAERPMLKPNLEGTDGGGYAFGSFTIGVHYDGYNGTGASVTVVGTSCIGGWWNTPSWFDNRESSSYNGCYRLRHYDKPNKVGAGTNTYGVGQVDNLPGWMNNRTESVAYFSS